MSATMALGVDALPAWTRLSPLVPEERAWVDVIAAALRDGDGLALQRVLRELVPDVRRWVLRAIGPHRELEDAVQEALVEIASALHRFEGRSSLHTLAHRIATRAALRHVSKRKHVSLEPDEEPRDPGDPSRPSRTVASRSGSISMCPSSRPLGARRSSSA